MITTPPITTLDPNEPLITYKEAAAILNCGYHAARRLILSGRIPSRMGGPVLKTTASACRAYNEIAKSEIQASYAKRNPSKMTAKRQRSEASERARKAHETAQRRLQEAGL